jgi:DNA topoisomerase-1
MYCGGSDTKWHTLSHNGVIFQEQYKKHNTPLLYDKQKIILPEKSEEYATIYAKLSGSDYVKESKFNKNFFKDWKKILKEEKVENINDFEKCDFSIIYNYLLDLKEKKKNESKEEQELKKEKKMEEEEKYKYAMVDGKKQQVGNFRVEPSGIFIGRGCHPKAGKIKLRTYPEDITINIDKNAKIPQLPDFYKTHKWGNIIHDNHKEWLCSWYDEITNKTKYVWLSHNSEFKAKSDETKFDMARKLKKNIDSIRTSNYLNIIQNKDLKTKQLALALFLIDKCAIRVGNEKDTSETAESYGACSLKIKHIDINVFNTIKLDFLGKDSVRYVNTIPVENVIYIAFMDLINNKNKDDDLFDLITPVDLNNYLKTMLPDLTAKIFRTYNASFLFQEEITKINEKYKNADLKNNEVLNQILNEYLNANAKVALLCNHQKNISKNLNEQIDKINEKIKQLKEKKKNEKNKEKIANLDKKILEQKNKRELKINLSNISLTTSKLNYIDPRISIAFIKKYNFPENITEKIMPEKLLEKFWWAKEVDEKWIF